MKHPALTLLFLLCMISSCIQQSKQEGENSMTTKDEEDIYRENDSFLEAWNKADAQAAASFFTEDGMRVGAMGDIQHGREEIAAAYDKLLHQGMPGAKAKTEKGTIRMLTPELAVWQGGLEIEKPDGSPPLKGHVMQVMKKVQGRWLVLEAHPKLFPNPPPQKQ
jgi:uncharacterized protein (TIGR02246 family)